MPRARDLCNGGHGLGSVGGHRLHRLDELAEFAGQSPPPAPAVSNPARESVRRRGELAGADPLLSELTVATFATVSRLPATDGDRRW
jgi:hypothetical protein